MKVRHGFVSNSSSSSFCILGTVVGTEEAFEIYKKMADAYNIKDSDKFETVEGFSADHYFEMPKDCPYEFRFGNDENDRIPPEEIAIGEEIDLLVQIHRAPPRGPSRCCSRSSGAPYGSRSEACTFGYSGVS